MTAIGTAALLTGLAVLFVLALAKVRQRRLDEQAERFRHGEYDRLYLDSRPSAGDWFAVVGALAADWFVLCVFIAATWLVVRWMVHAI